MIITTDLHFGVRNSNKFFIQVQKEFFEGILFPFILGHGVKDVLHLGDLLDSRTSISFSTLKHLYDFLSWFDRNGVNFHSIMGNHDILLKNSAECSILRELSSNFSRFSLIDRPKRLEFRNQEFLAIPWICNEDSLGASIGFLESNCGPKSIVCGHLEISGFKVTENYISGKDSLPAEILRVPKKVFSGHFHLSGQNGNITYVGTPYQLTWNEAGNKKRFFHFDGKEFTEVENTGRIYHKIFWQKGVTDVQDFRGLKGFAKVYILEDSLDAAYEEFLKGLSEANEFQNITTVSLPGTQKDLSQGIGDIGDPVSILLDSVAATVPKGLSKDDIKKEILEILEELKKEEA
jgi:DNA repair exonuclease SbcCD nuclease subunit